MVPGIVRRALADREYYESESDCTALHSSLKQTAPASKFRHSISSWLRGRVPPASAHPTPFRPANHPTSSPPSGPLEARPTWHLAPSTLYRRRLAYLGTPALPCPALSCLASPRLSTLPLLTSPYYAVRSTDRYKVVYQIINPQPVLCRGQNISRPLPRPALLLHSHLIDCPPLLNRPCIAATLEPFLPLQRTSPCTLANTMAAKPRL